MDRMSPELPADRLHTLDQVPPSLSGTTAFNTVQRSIIFPHQSQHAGLARFRSAVARIIQLNRMSRIFASSLTGSTLPGAEPGIDPHRAGTENEYAHIRQRCRVKVIDFNSIRSAQWQGSNRGVREFLTRERPKWARVRWINVGGISWDVIQPLAIHYDLHPLSLEDVLSSAYGQRPRERSKADYYSAHLFIRVVCHRLHKYTAEAFTEAEVTPHNTLAAVQLARAMSRRVSSRRNGIPVIPRTTSPDPIEMDEKSDATRTQGSGSQYMGSSARLLEEGPDDSEDEDAAAAAMDAANRRMVSALKSETGNRVNVDLSQLFVFLTRDGTLITIHDHPSLDFTEPIETRLSQRDTVLRSNSDPSLLLEGILDLIADRAVEVIEEYQRRILELERKTLLEPEMEHVQSLHVLSEDLNFHKRTLGPFKSLIYGLRRYDADRSAALIPTTEEDEFKPHRAVGYMSYKSKVYLADVHDHMEYVMSSLDLFVSIAERLIQYSFNMASWEMSIIMRRLTLATIIFLPPTLLAGYFGMNFTREAVKHTSDVLYWKIAIPMIAASVTLFMWRDIASMIHLMKKRRRARKALKGRRWLMP